VADLVSKHLIFHFMTQTGEDRYPVLGSWLVLVARGNPDGPFGLRLPGGVYTFIALSIVALGAVAWMLRTTPREKRFMAVALGLVVAGALGNLVDRLWLGEVRDFIYVEAIPWPPFNVADACVSVAAAMLVLEIIREELAERRTRT
jgi:signal peptidase II